MTFTELADKAICPNERFPSLVTVNVEAAPFSFLTDREIRELVSCGYTRRAK